MKKKLTTATVLFWLFAMQCWQPTVTAKTNPDFTHTTQTPTKRPTGFVENKGQFRDQHGKPNPDVLFIADFGGMKVLLRKDGFSYETYQVKPKWVDPATIPYKILTITDKGDTLESWPGQVEAQKNLMYHFHRVDVELVGANLNPEILAEGSVGETKRYVNIENGGESIEVAGFSQIRYNGVYPGIDLVVYSQTENGGFKYDFILSPGANLSAIELQYSGALKLELDDLGNLELTTKQEIFHENIPSCYLYDASGARNEITKFKYNLNGNRLSFIGNIPEFYNELIIDPMIFRHWGTYFGGEAEESANGFKIDPSGNIFVCGTTSSFQNIATSGVWQDSLTLPNDGYLAKFSKNGNLVWSTYLGGISANQMDLSYNTIVITGSQICSFDTSGNFNWSRNGSGISNGISIDVYGNILAAGDSVVKFSSTGMRLWGNKYGDQSTYVTGIVTSDDGYYYITGHTKDSTGIVTPGCYQPVYQGNCGALCYFYYEPTGAPFGDGFLSKFSGDGTVIWGTYFGGENADIGRAIALDKQGNIVVTGETNSLEGVATEGAYRTINSLNATNFQRSYVCFGCPDPCPIVNSSCGFSIPYCTWLRPALILDSIHPHQLIDGFVMKFSPDGEKLWGSYFGGTGEEFPRSIVTDTLSNIIVAGYTSSVSQFNYENSMYQHYYGATLLVYTSFLISFNPEGANINWQSNFGYAEYLGGNMMYTGAKINALAIDNQEDLVIAGSSNLADSITGVSSFGAFKENITGNSDSFIAMITLFPNNPPPLTYLQPCAGDSLCLMADTRPENDTSLFYQWYKNHIEIENETGRYFLIQNVAPSDSGLYTCRITKGVSSTFTPGYHITAVRNTPVFDTLLGGMINDRVVAADINNDSNLDLFGNNGLYLNTNNQFFLSDDSIDFQQDYFDSYDFDGDGDIDILGITDIYTNNDGNFLKENLNANVSCWGDFDNDGDIDGIDFSSSIMLKNNNGQFSIVPIIRNGTQFPPSLGKAVDMDHDGDLDIVIYCGSIFKESQFINLPHYGVWYENQQYSWVQRSIGESGVNVSFDLADFNSDQHVDVVVSFISGGNYFHTQVYLNNSLSFSKVADFVSGKNYSKWPNHPRVQCADFDNDGDMDFISLNELFINNNGAFVRFPTTYDILSASGLINNYNSPADFNNDGILELLCGSSVYQSLLCSSSNNLKPTAPAISYIDSDGEFIYIHWDPAVDDNTAQSNLSYNLRIGNYPQQGNIMPSNSDTSGFRRIVSMGNVGQALTWKISQLPVDNYYFAVQAVDNSFAGGDFSTELTFYYSGIDIRSIDNSQALIHWRGLPSNSYSLVFLKPVATGQPTPEPSATYLANTVFGQGSELDGWYCVFNGSGDSLTVTGLTAGTTYRVAVFNYLFNQTYDTPLLHNFTTEQIVMPDMVKIFGDAPFTLQATAASGITSFDYTTDSLQVCAIAGDTATLTGCGTALIRVRHAGNSHYLPDSTTALLTVNFQMGVPVSINGPDTVCRGDAQLLYAIAPLPYASSYGWTLPQGVIGSSDSSSILLTFGTGAASGVVTVRGINLCGEGDPAQLTVTITQPPATAGTIAGSVTPCTGTTHTFSVTPQPGVAFNWTVPQGWTMLSGQGTPSITATIGTSPGVVGVFSSNFCGQSDTSFLAVNPMTIPSQPGDIAGTTDTCTNVAGLTYSVTPQPGVSYNWIVPNGWTITSGQGTASIIVTTALQGGLLWAIPSNICGSGPGDSLEIAVLQPPAQPSAIAGNTLCCQGDTVSFGVEPLPGVSYQWQLPAGWILLTGQGTGQITAAAGYNGGAVTVTPSNVCGEGQPATTSVAVNFVQADAGANQLIAYGASTTLNGNAANGSGNYNWNWQPASLLLNPTLQNPVTTSLTATQQFTLQVADQLTGCADTDTVLVEIQGMPLAAYGTATPDTTCPGGMVQLNAVASYGTGQYEYIWTSNPAGFLSTLPNPQVFPEQSTYYNLVVTDGNATLTDEVIVTVTPLPEAPGQPMGPDTVDIAITPVSSYFTPPVAGATAYQWSLEPWMMGTLTPNGNQATVQWSNIGTAMLTVSALNDCGLSTSDPLPVVVDNTIGVATLQPDGVVVVPNPFGDALTVASHHATPLSIELFDASGALVATLANPQPVSTLPTAGLAPGVYHLRVTFANGVVVKKVVKE